VAEEDRGTMSAQEFADADEPLGFKQLGVWSLNDELQSEKVWLAEPASALHVVVTQESAPVEETDALTAAGVTVRKV
jgi:hypothetical protein